MLDRNREFGWLIDERANAAQREALSMIVLGKAGGSFAAWADLTITTMGVEFVPLRVSYTADSWEVEAPDRVSGRGGPFRKFMVPDGQVCTIINAPRPEVTPGNITLGQALKNEVSAFGKRWSWPNYSAKHIPFDLRGPGTFTWRRPLA